MTWLKLDDAFADHPKVAGLTDAAFRLHVEALCYCARQLTDGVVPASMVARMGGDHPDELVGAGLWMECAEGYAVRDYLDYNPSRTDVLEQRKRRAEAGRKGAQARWDGKSHSTSHGKGHSTSYSDRNAPDPTRPLDKTRSPVDNSRPQLRAVGELRTDESDGSPVPSTSPAVQEALRAARQHKGET